MNAHSRIEHTGVRLAPATRTRLRHGRLLTVARSEICDCTLYDLENGSVGIILPDGEMDLAETLYVADIRLTSISLARITWRMGANLGISYLEKPETILLRRNRNAK